MFDAMVNVSFLSNRANLTGQQPADTISDFASEVRKIMAEAGLPAAATDDDKKKFGASPNPPAVHTLAGGDIIGEIFPPPNDSIINIADHAVVEAKLADNSVTSAKIKDGEVKNQDLATGAVDSSKIADGTIATVDVGDAQITTPKIADANITTAKLADSSVNSSKIADNTIINGDVAANAAIAPTKLALSGVGSDVLNGLGSWMDLASSHNHHNLYYTKTQLDAGQLDGQYARRANNLSDLTDIPTARNILDVYSKGEGDARYLRRDNDLADLANKTAARSNLGLGDLSTLNHDNIPYDLTVKGADGFAPGKSAAVYLGDNTNYIASENGSTTKVAGMNGVTVRDTRNARDLAVFDSTTAGLSIPNGDVRSRGLLLDDTTQSPQGANLQANAAPPHSMTSTNRTQSPNLGHGLNQKEVKQAETDLGAPAPGEAVALRNQGGELRIEPASGDPATTVDLRVSGNIFMGEGVGAPVGDMLKSVYDTNNSGKVDSFDNQGALATMNVIDEAHIQADAVTTSKIKNNSVDINKLSITGSAATANIIGYNGTNLQWVAKPAPTTDHAALTQHMDFASSKHTGFCAADDYRLSNARLCDNNFVDRDIARSNLGCGSVSQININGMVNTVLRGDGVFDLIKPGSFEATLIADTDSWNSAKATGVYYCKSAAASTYSPPVPSGLPPGPGFEHNTWSVGLVFNNNNSHVTQIARNVNSQTLYVRFRRAIVDPLWSEDKCWEGWFPLGGGGGGNYAKNEEENIVAAQANDPMTPSGIYDVMGSLDVPRGAVWNHLFVSKHRKENGDGNLYGAQIAIPLLGGGDEMYFRRSENSATYGNWHRVVKDTELGDLAMENSSGVNKNVLIKGTQGFDAPGKTAKLSLGDAAGTYLQNTHSGVFDIYSNNPITMTAGNGTFTVTHNDYSEGAGGTLYLNAGPTPLVRLKATMNCGDPNVNSTVTLERRENNAWVNVIGGGASGITSVSHDGTLVGDGNGDPLRLNTTNGAADGLVLGVESGSMKWVAKAAGVGDVTAEKPPPGVDPHTVPWNIACWTENHKELSRTGLHVSNTANGWTPDDFNIPSAAACDARFAKIGEINHHNFIYLTNEKKENDEIIIEEKHFDKTIVVFNTHSLAEGGTVIIDFSNLPAISDYEGRVVRIIGMARKDTSFDANVLLVYCSSRFMNSYNSSEDVLCFKTNNADNGFPPMLEVTIIREPFNPTVFRWAVVNIDKVGWAKTITDLE